MSIHQKFPVPAHDAIGYSQAIDPDILEPVAIGSALKSAVATVPLALGFTVATIKYFSLSLLWALPLYSLWGVALLLMFVAIAMVFEEPAA